MLSKKDIELKLLKGHIAVHPLNNKTIDYAGIRLTASSLVWSYNEASTDQIEWKKAEHLNGKINIPTRTYIENEKKPGCRLKKTSIVDGNIYVPGRTSIVVMTNEAIYLNQAIAGACYTRVDIAWKGLGFVATPMKPARSERLLIIIHNRTCKPQLIPLDGKIAVISLHELKSAQKIDPERDNEAQNEREDMINKFDNKFDIVRAYKYYPDNQEDFKDEVKDWEKMDGAYIRAQMKKSDVYKKLEKKRCKRVFIGFTILVIILLIIANCIPLNSGLTLVNMVARETVIGSLIRALNIIVSIVTVISVVLKAISTFRKLINTNKEQKSQ